MPVRRSNAANRLFLKAVVFTVDAAGISNRRNDQPAAAERADALRFTCDHNIRDCSDTFLMLLVGHLRIHIESSSSQHSGECSRQNGCFSNQHFFRIGSGHCKALRFNVARAGEHVVSEYLHGQIAHLHLSGRRRVFVQQPASDGRLVGRQSQHGNDFEFSHRIRLPSMRVHTFQEGDFPRPVGQAMPATGSNAAERFFLKAAVFAADAAGIPNELDDELSTADRAGVRSLASIYHVSDGRKAARDILFKRQLSSHTESSSSPHSFECSHRLPLLAPERPASDRGAHHPSIPVHTTPQYSWRGIHRSMNPFGLLFL
nr:MAG TPA: hypothetical protein [Caudoviricetes sp.]